MAFGRRWMAAAVCVPLLVVGGCSDDEPKPKFSPSKSPSATDTSTPEPEAWEVKSEEGAVAFAEHWMAVFTTAMNAGDSQELRSVSKSECKTCIAIADRIDSIDASGGFYRSPGWRVLQAVAADGMPADEAVVSLRILQGEEEFKESADSKVVRNPASRASYSARIEWSGGVWQMSELRLAT